MEQTYVSRKEAVVFGTAALGQGMIYAAMSSYISDFYLNVMGLSPVFVMLLMLLARLWDAINDPIMGLIVDKKDGRFGKYKPYVLFTVLPISVLTFCMFFVPAFANKVSPYYNESGTYVYVAFIYVFWGMIYTASDVPFWSLPNAMTPNAHERGKVISVARTLNGIGSAVPIAIITFIGYVKINGSPIDYKTRYIIMAVVASVCGGLLFVASYLTAKERVKLPKPVKTGRQTGSLTLLFKHKPTMLVILTGLLAFGRYMAQTAAVHVARYTFSLEGMEIAQSQSTVQLVFSLTSAAGMFIAMLLCPFLIKKVSYKTLVLTSCIGGGSAALVGYVVGLLTGYSLWIFVPFLFLSCLPLGVLNVVSYAMIGDCLDDLELKTGRRTAGLGLSCQTFVNKLDSAIATTLIIAMYMIVGLRTSDMTATQTDFLDPTTLPSHIRGGMFMLVSLIPAVSLFACCIPMFFYPLSGANKEKMLADLQKARVERGVVIE